MPQNSLCFEGTVEAWQGGSGSVHWLPVTKLLMPLWLHAHETIIRMSGQDSTILIMSRTVSLVASPFSLPGEQNSDKQHKGGSKLDQ